MFLMQKVVDLVGCGLVDIVVFDSYIKGKHSIFHLAGHANISGTNGRGKTSTLSLIPLFFGATPDKLVNRNKGRFIDFYLPSDQSFIAFQYQRFDGMCSVFVYANKSRDGSLCYRFVKGDIEAVTQDETFKELLKSTKSISDTFKKLSFNPKFEMTNQIENTVDYEAIICNNKKALRLKGGLASETQRFSLCHTDYQLKSLAFLTMVSMSDKDDLFEKLKAMMVDSFGLSDVDVASPPKEFNITELVACIRTLVKLRSKGSRYKAGIELNQVNKSLYSDLLFYRDESKRLLSAYTFKVEDIAQKIKVLEGEKEEFVSQINLHLGNNAERQKTIEGQINSLQETLKNITAKEVFYNSAHIDSKRAEYQSIGNLQSRRDLAAQNIERIKNASSDIYNNLDKEKAAIDAKVRELVDNCGLRINAVKDERAEVNKRKYNEVKVLQDKLNEQIKLLRDDSEKTFNLLQQELNKANYEHGFSSSYTEEENQKLKEYDLEMDGLRHELATKKEHIRGFELTVGDKSEKLKATHQQLNACLNAIIDLEAEINHYRDLHFGGKNLLSHLRLNLDADDFRDAIKVINKDLLIRNDIEVVKHDDSNLFFGLGLNLQNVSTPQEADSEDELRTRMEALDNQLKEYKNNRASIEKQASVETEDLKAHKTELQRLNLDASKTESSINNLLKAKESFNYQCSEKAKKRKSEARENIEKIQSKISAHKKDMELRAKALNNEYGARERDFLLSIDSELEKLAIHERNINLEIESIRQDGEQKKEEFRLISQNRLKEQGVDIDVVRKFEAELADADANLKRVSSYGRIITEYDDWVKITLSRKPEYIENIQNLSNEMRSLEASNKSLRSEKQAKEVEIKSKILALSEEQEKFKANLATLRLFLERLEDHVQDFGNVEPSIKAVEDFDVFKSSLDKAFSDFKQNARNLKNLINLLDEDLRDDPAGTICQLWVKRKELHSEHREHPYHHMLIIDEMEQFFNSDIKNAERAKAVHFTNCVTQVNEYYESLHTFKNRVKRMSKELDEYIQIQNPFEDVKNIKLSVSSLIDEKMPVYGQMKKLKDQFALSPLSKVVYESDEVVLPESELISSLNTVMTSLRSTNFNQKSKNDLVTMSISLVENGTLRVINSNTTFRDFSSKGLSRLVILMIFSALTRYLNQDPELKIHIPFDELGEISQVNCVRLFRLLEDRNIRVFCAQPDVNEHLYSFFEHKYLIDINNGLKQVKVDESFLSESNPLLGNG